MQAFSLFSVLFLALIVYHKMAFNAVISRLSAIYNHREQTLYYIFNRFYRSRHSNDGAGIGLGLPLTKAIIENQKGIIEVESQLGKGTVFSVYLPIPTKVQD